MVHCTVGLHGLSLHQHSSSTDATKWDRTYKELTENMSECGGTVEPKLAYSLLSIWVSHKSWGLLMKQIRVQGKLGVFL